MSRRAARGANRLLSTSGQVSRESSDQDEEENDAILDYSTPLSKLQHRQHHQLDIDTSNDPDQYHSAHHATQASSSAIGLSSAVEVDEISLATMATSTTELSNLPSTRTLNAEEEIITTTAPPTPAYSKWSTIGHQVCFLATGIFSTIAVQWLYYQGAASGTSMLTVFFNYIGMICVGLVYAFQSWHEDRKQRKMATAAMAGHAHVEYDVLLTESNEMSEIHAHDDQSVKDHLELVSSKMHGSSKQRDLDTDSDSEDGDDESNIYDIAKEEKQRLRMQDKGSSSSSAEAASDMRSRMGLHWPAIQVAVMDVIANGLITIGFFYVGSGMYQVIYSSIVIWCAILTRIFLSRKLNNIQWVAIVGVTFGLAISAFGTVQDVSPDGPVQSWLEKSFGALITLGATFLYSCVYVLSDKVLSTFKPKPIPEKVCTMVGTYASLLTFVYLCLHTFPKWKTEVMDVVATNQGNWAGIIIVYPLLTISSMLHSLNYYVLLSRINNIAVGILQSLRAVLVFVMSHYLFCHVSSTQCFNEWKFVSAIVVIGCVTLFSFNTPPSAPAPNASVSSPKGLTLPTTAAPIPCPSTGQRRNPSPS
ncbi:hypothetical protein BGZ50_008913 [Haplosporangium sp. Z 11]|nr:hypothetical protein BGZ50_008913 [Haplosporangium sp. Z 11]